MFYNWSLLGRKNLSYKVSGKKMLGAGKDHLIGLGMGVSSLMETRLGTIPTEGQDEDCSSMKL
jgi:hypothetical protein